MVYFVVHLFLGSDQEANIVHQALGAANCGTCKLHNSSAEDGPPSDERLCTTHVHATSRATQHWCGLF